MRLTVRSFFSSPKSLLTISAGAVLTILLIIGVEEYHWTADYLSRIKHADCPVYGDYVRPCTLDDYQANLTGSWLLPSRWPFVLAYMLYGAAAVWLGILIRRVFRPAQTASVKLWHTFWLVFLPASIAVPLLFQAVTEARRAALIDPLLMVRYEHTIFYSAPFLLIPAAAIVWFAPDSGKGSPWPALAKCAVVLITIASLWMQVAVVLLTIVGFKDS